MSSVGVMADVVAILAFGALGALCAWITRRFTTLSARNFYAPAAVVRWRRSAWRSHSAPGRP